MAKEAWNNPSLIVWAVLSASCISGLKAAGQEAGVVPQAVRDFLASNYEHAKEDAVAVSRDNGGQMSPEYTLLYYWQMPGFELPDRSAWLVGYRLGRVGNGLIPENRIVIVGSSRNGEGVNGGVTKLPQSFAGDEMIVVHAGSKWLIASSFYNGRHVPHRVIVGVIGEKTKSVLSYQSPSEVSWDSVLYVADSIDGMMPDIYKKRVVRDFADKTKRVDYAEYRYDGRADKYGSEQRLSEGEFVAKTKTLDSRRRISQHGQVVEDEVDRSLRVISASDRTK